MGNRFGKHHVDIQPHTPLTSTKAGELFDSVASTGTDTHTALAPHKARCLLKAYAAAVGIKFDKGAAERIIASEEQLDRATFLRIIAEYAEECDQPLSSSMHVLAEGNTADGPGLPPMAPGGHFSAGLPPGFPMPPGGHSSASGGLGLPPGFPMPPGGRSSAGGGFGMPPPRGLPQRPGGPFSVAGSLPTLGAASNEQAGEDSEKQALSDEFYEKCDEPHCAACLIFVSDPAVDLHLCKGCTKKYCKKNCMHDETTMAARRYRPQGACNWHRRSHSFSDAELATMIAKKYVPKHPEVYEWREEWFSPSFLSAPRNGASFVDTSTGPNLPHMLQQQQEQEQQHEPQHQLQEQKKNPHEEAEGEERRGEEQQEQQQQQHVYTLRLFSPEFCRRLVSELCHLHAAFPQLHFDERGLFLARFGFRRLFERIGQQLTDSFVHSQLPDTRLVLKNGFVVRYEAGKSHLAHSDDSDLTLNCCLGDVFEGGELVLYPPLDIPPPQEAHSGPFGPHSASSIKPYFDTGDFGIGPPKPLGGPSLSEAPSRGAYGRDGPTQGSSGRVLVLSHEVGRAHMHDGHHRHAARALASGTRINLLLWFSAERPAFPFLELPDELQNRVLENLPPTGLLSFSACSRQCRKIARADGLWETLYSRAFPESFSERLQLALAVGMPRWWWGKDSTTHVNVPEPEPDSWVGRYAVKYAEMENALEAIGRPAIMKCTMEMARQREMQQHAEQALIRSTYKRNVHANQSASLLFCGLPPDDDA